MRKDKKGKIKNIFIHINLCLLFYRELIWEKKHTSYQCVLFSEKRKNF